MDCRFVCALCLSLQLVLLPLQVVSQGDFSLLDALDGDSKPSTTTSKPKVASGGTGGDFSLEDFFDAGGLITTTTLKTPTKVGPKVPSKTKDPVKPKQAADDFDLADALDPKKDIGSRDKNKQQEGGFSDSDLIAVSEDDSYKPDKGKGGHLSGEGGQVNQQDNKTEEVGTIAGIVSVVAMALVGAVSSYISYQKKKLCFSIQQSLNVDFTKAENSEQVAAAEPQVQQTHLEPPNAEPPTEVKVVP